MTIVTKTILSILTVMMLSQPINMMGMHYIRDFVAATTAKVSESIMAQPYKSAAFALGAAATVGLGYGLYKYIYNLNETLKRTYYVGAQKFVAPEGAVVRNSPVDVTVFAHKNQYYFELPKQQLPYIITDHAQKKGNILQVFHSSYNDNTGMRIIVHSDVPYKEKPMVAIHKTTGNLVIVIPEKNSVKRVDYIFYRPVNVHGEKVNK